MPREPLRDAKRCDHLELVLRVVRERALARAPGSEALQRVAREERRGLVELHVAGGLSAAKHVVVHAGQVVVDERVGMDHLDRRGRHLQAISGRRRLSRGEHSIARTRLPPVQRRIAHRIVQRSGATRGWGRSSPGRFHAAGDLARHAVKSGALTVGRVEVAQLPTLEDRDARLGVGELALAELDELRPALVGGEGLLRAAACRPPCGPRWLELLERLLEGEGIAFRPWERSDGGLPL
jgi:hypothetical protein